ncbi:4-hydroxyphenylacetate 3-monooxygenase, reductase component [Neisseria mucosa]|uniref:4-hydroxyphenylacetate 3-monooxygenase reductase component n=1 Tax=Neisseria mucosa TaxID=488 RepID=A0AAW6ZC52_NEIMU|nr:4-hydroxyphenylacetate 3-monooxygenase, reductase component [Neisseria mucosa]MDK6725942.1 4-hydroxyphenylacetate 3-monooxygenase, reductase component [Neisseria mucosa]MDK6870260.1 4-hydroxyphenylacetate 3-monooxygenase, reductase component [Neisseria mucosa]MDK8109944.1 4-hydroxyphenylacetate 3-monooxygenase, reductase component [Neisseria mucosa]MDK8361212.1 4-hydroxyphenylacetate 3-monooxygenase, reductase component [Neisseria mucosa]
MTDSAHTLKHPFRDAMASCAAGVHVITTDGESGRYGITMTAVTPVTDEPPTIMLCINRKAAIIPILQTNRDLCINTLSESQQDIAEHFAGLTGLSPEERFAYHIWNRGKTGQLEVEDALAHLHGRIVSQHEIGTHFIFYVEINEIKNSGTHSPALLYFRRQFKSLE